MADPDRDREPNRWDDAVFERVEAKDTEPIALSSTDEGAAPTKR